MNRNGGVHGNALLQLFPGPGDRVPLHGLYLDPRFGPPLERTRSFVYANYIVSLDGRISLPNPRNSGRSAPPAITNARDWRLFQELATGADALLVSGQHVRDHPRDIFTASFPVSSKPEHADLLRWRRTRGLAPQPAIVIVTASAELPPLRRLVESGRPTYVATGAAAEPSKLASLTAEGVRVLNAGSGTRVEGRRLIEVLARESHRNVALISGGEMLRTLIAADALDRLYLTLACRILGGVSFDTLLTGPVLERARGFRLKALHYDAETAESSTVEQLFASFDRGDTYVAPESRKP